MPCSLYIYDRNNGELQSKTSDHAASTLATPSEESRFAASKDVVFLAAYTLTSLGYMLGLKKCVFTPQKRIKYLGFISDSDQEAYYLPPNKQTSFLALVNTVLSGSCFDYHPSAPCGKMYFFSPCCSGFSPLYQ